jgi:putative heme-binding domain-containing protein
LDDQIAAVWGRVRDRTPAELNELIARVRDDLPKGRGSMERGRKVFENQCAKCHRFEGKGHDVGPALDGADRSIDYLLVNVLDPNRVVGQPYFTRVVALKSGRVETGLLAAEDPQTITLKTENDALKAISRADIEELTVQEKSLMPEGLNKNLSVQDFRDLIRYLMADPFLTDVGVAGPLKAGESPAVDPGACFASKGIDWSWPIVGPSGRIALPASKADMESDVYVAGEVVTRLPQHTRLFLGASAGVQCWINGRKVYEGKPAPGPDQAGVDVDLQAGRNTILVRVRYRDTKDALYIRLADPKRQLAYPTAEDLQRELAHRR